MLITGDNKGLHLLKHGFNMLKVDKIIGTWRSQGKSNQETSTDVPFVLAFQILDGLLHAASVNILQRKTLAQGANDLNSESRWGGDGLSLGNHRFTGASQCRFQEFVHQAQFLHSLMLVLVEFRNARIRTMPDGSGEASVKDNVHHLIGQQLDMLHNQCMS